MSAVSVAIPKGEIKDILKYIGIFLAIVLAIFIAYRLYKKFLNVGRDVNAVADAIEDKALDNKISKEAGIPVQDVEAARVIAKHLGVNLETDKDMSTMDKLTHIQWDSETIEILGRVKSSSQMALVANFYKNKVTNGNNLYTDIKAVLSSGDLRKIQFIEKIQNFNG